MVDKSERLLDLVALLLDTPRLLSADEIHNRFELYPEGKDAFRRAFERDKAELREMGVPIVVGSIPGTDPPEQGYRIPPEEYYLRDPGLDPDELAALRLAVDTIRLEGIDADGGLHKLAGEVGPAGERRRAEIVLPGDRHVALVFDAIARGRQLRFRYGDALRVVDPLHLHTGKGRWHLQGYDHTRDDHRQFRLDRIDGDVDAGDPGSVTVTELPARPTLRGWELGEGPGVEARVLVGPAQAAVARHEVGDDAVVETRPDGSIVVALDVRFPDALRGFVLGFLDDAELVGPPDYRDDLVAWLTALADGGPA